MGLCERALGTFGVVLLVSACTLGRPSQSTLPPEGATAADSVTPERATARPTSAAPPTTLPSPTVSTLPSATALPVVYTGTPFPNECRTSRDGLLSLTSGLELPDRFTEPDPAREPTDFDVNSYFTVLRHLSVEEGHSLDWVYFSDHLGGKPLIYARPNNQPPHATYTDYLHSLGESPSDERSYGRLPHAYDYMESVRADDTPESYLQLLVLVVMADQFHLFWHGLYNDAFFMCDEADVQPGMGGLTAFDLSLPEDVMDAARGFQLSPTVRLGAESATVRYAVFTKWGGFIEVSYEISRDFPHPIISGDSRLLVEYDCGIMF